MIEYDAVAFDFDGTLYSFESIKRPFMWRNWYWAKSLRACLRARQAMRSESFRTPEDMLQFQDDFLMRHLNISAEKARERFEKLMIHRLAAALSPKRQRPGLTEFLDHLLAQDKKIILISDLPINEKLQTIGLWDYPWSAKVAADDIGVLKPKAAIFETALNEAQVTAAKTIYIGDRVDTDAEGALALGMNFIQMATLSRQKLDDFEKSSWPVFQDFYQVSSYLF